MGGGVRLAPLHGLPVQVDKATSCPAHKDTCCHSKSTCLDYYQPSGPAVTRRACLHHRMGGTPQAFHQQLLGAQTALRLLGRRRRPPPPTAPPTTENPSGSLLKGALHIDEDWSQT